MNHWFNLLNIAGSAALVAFGLYVWRVDPSNRRNQAFVLFAVGFSLGTALSNVEQILGLQGTTLWAEAVLRGTLYGLGGIGAAWFGIATVEPDRRTALKWLPVPGVLAVAALVAALVLNPVGVPGAVRVVLSLGFIASLLGGSAFAALLLADDFRRPEHSLERRREQAFLAAALVLYPGFYLTFLGALYATPLIDPSGGFRLGSAFVTAALLGTSLSVVAAWVRSTEASQSSAAGRNVALLAAGMGVVGLALSIPDTSGQFGVPFLARVGAVGILGYGILRHQVLGIDEKVRFGISKTTVAGVFVAVFFIVSEGAQVMFAGFAGSELLGIIAAGALLFALAPIQKAADRIAKEVVPGGADPSGTDPAKAKELYRYASEKAYADSTITREEEQKLADLADQLGLSAGEAMRIRREVEDEAGGGDAG